MENIYILVGIQTTSFDSGIVEILQAFDNLEAAKKVKKYADMYNKLVPELPEGYLRGKVSQRELDDYNKSVKAWTDNLLFGKPYDAFEVQKIAVENSG